jgi:hypothetical protein
MLRAGLVSAHPAAVMSSLREKLVQASGAESRQVLIPHDVAKARAVVEHRGQRVHGPAASSLDQEPPVLCVPVSVANQSIEGQCSGPP